MSVSSVSNVTNSTNTNTNTQGASNELDQNSFLKILMAELTNQDPTSSTADPTAYVSQLAQFTSLEQMTNLNTTMTMSSANSMIGKTVTLSDTDSSGNPYTGVVQSVSKSGSNVSLTVAVTDNGQSGTIQIPYNDVTTIAEDSSTGSTTNTTV
jgi:flagellar basal-body rod modification protein FlgD